MYEFDDATPCEFCHEPLHEWTEWQGCDQYTSAPVREAECPNSACPGEHKHCEECATQLIYEDGEYLPCEDCEPEWWAELIGGAA